jgi:hypothetical protein
MPIACYVGYKTLRCQKSSAVGACLMGHCGAAGMCWRDE